MNRLLAALFPWPLVTPSTPPSRSEVGRMVVAARVRAEARRG